jgi:glutathione S-transferase
MTIKIYGVPRSRAIRTLWMVHELGIPFELIEVPPGPGGSRKPEFLRLNPNGQVPFIDDSGLVLSESLAINLYLAKKHGAPLGPADLAEDAQMTMWGFWAVNDIEPNALIVLRNSAELPAEQRSPAALGAALAALNAPLRVLDGKLTAADLLEVGKAPHMIFLNACESGRMRGQSSNGPRPTHFGGQVSLAEGFLLSGIANFIGTYWPVNDVAALKFAHTLYGSLLSGKSLSASMREARQATRTVNSRDWANYLHFGDPLYTIRVA